MRRIGRVERSLRGESRKFWYQKYFKLFLLLLYGINPLFNRLPEFSGDFRGAGYPFLRFARFPARSGLEGRTMI